VDFDGGARKNPGVGVSGSLLLLVRGGSCSVLAGRSEFLGVNITNNFAEFSGLNSGLQLALDFLAQSADPVPGIRITATGDSELVVQAMLARRALCDPALVALVKQADELVATLEALGCVVDFTPVRRALKGEADALAIMAIDAKAFKLPREQLHA
jgi:ribonuclease HI